MALLRPRWIRTKQGPTLEECYERLHAARPDEGFNLRLDELRRTGL